MKLNKRKSIMIPVISLAAIALGTIGFSTWIISAENTSSDVTLNVTVGDVEDQRLTFSAFVGTTEEPTSSNVDLAFDATQDEEGSITSSQNTEKMSFYYSLTIGRSSTDTDIDFTADATNIIDNISITLTDSGSFLSNLIESEYIVAPVTTLGVAQPLVESEDFATPSNVYYDDVESYIKTSYSTTVSSETIKITGQIGFGWGLAFGNDNPVTEKGDTPVDTLNAFKTAANSGASLKLTFSLNVK